MEYFLLPDMHAVICVKVNFPPHEPMTWLMPQVSYGGTYFCPGAISPKSGDISIVGHIRRHVGGTGSGDKLLCEYY